MSKFSNSVWNTIAVPVRWLGSVFYAWGWDIIKTWCNIITDLKNVAVDTKKKAWETLSSSWSTWKWYNKLYQVPAGIVVTWATIVEWAVRTALVEPTRNFILNVRDTVWNFFNNIWNTIKKAFDTTRPVSDFSYEKLKMKKPTFKNRMSKLAWWKK